MEVFLLKDHDYFHNLKSYQIFLLPVLYLCLIRIDRFGVIRGKNKSSIGVFSKEDLAVFLIPLLLHFLMQPIFVSANHVQNLRL